MAKGIRMLPTQSKTDNRGDKILSCVFVDLGGKTHRTYVGENKYPMVMRHDFSLYVLMYFISHKSNATEAFKKHSDRPQSRRYSRRSRGGAIRWWR